MKVHKSNIVTKTCKFCNIEFQSDDSLKRQRRMYCSMSCRAKGVNTGRVKPQHVKEKLSKMFSGEGNPFYGKTHDDKFRAMISERNTGRLKGAKNPNWKGGIRHGHDFGYLRNTDGSFIHRTVMEKHLGRKLLTSEHVHHINGIVTDNQIDNLQVMMNVDHAKLHYKKRTINKKGRFV